MTSMLLLPLKIVKLQLLLLLQGGAAAAV